MSKNTDNTKKAKQKKAKGEYHLVPTQYPKGHGHSGNWGSSYTRTHPVDVPNRVDISALLGTVKRRMTEGYLNTRMNRYNSVETNQNYVTKVMENPRTPEENRRTVILYVKQHPEKFTRVADNPEDPEYQRWADTRNGNAKRGFIRDFLRKYGGME